MTPWWGKDVSEELGIVTLGVLGIAGMAWLGVEAKELTIAIAGGLIGYLKGRQSNGPP